MPSQNFFKIKKEAMDIVNRANDIRMIDMEVSLAHDSYEKAKKELEKVALYILENRKKLKKGLGIFEGIIIDSALDKAISEMWFQATEEFYGIVEVRYSDIIKIFENGSKKSDTK